MSFPSFSGHSFIWKVFGIKGWYIGAPAGAYDHCFVPLIGPMACETEEKIKKPSREKAIPTED